MKNRIIYLTSLFILFLVACSEKKGEPSPQINEDGITRLPFTNIDLKEMQTFKDAPDNWKIVGEVYVDRKENKTVQVKKGTGVLVNMPTESNQGNLVSIFEHGDIAFECDVMMPVKSNSGVYFQSRYEVQLFDSWGVDTPKHGDMGGVYQRWDKTKEKGKEGFEGYAPKVNAAKAPGLWQHLSVIFHAPKFDGSGNKIKNAWFEEVQLNGAVIHKNIEVSGPTRGGLEEPEVAKAPLLIQGDHGPVAFRNIKYKLFEDKKVELVDVRLNEYENTLPFFPNLDSLTPIRQVETDTISATMATGTRPQKLLSYEGRLRIPESGDYIFDYKLNRAGGALLIDHDTIISMNGNYSLDSLRISKVTLARGEVPFKLIYNKHVPWQIGFGLYVEGPGIQRHNLHANSSLRLADEGLNPDFMIGLEEEPITQRGFWMHDGKKRTHCIAVGNPQGIHFAYDLETGSLLQAWNDDFMDATKMWQGRGEKQLGKPAGFTITFHGDVELAFLKQENSAWPKTISASNFKPLGYQFDPDGLPIFDYQIEDSKVSNKFIPLNMGRGLRREITVNASKEMWFKVADGVEIRQLPDGSYVVNDESYFIDFESEDVKPKIRKSGNMDELIVELSSGNQQLIYNIIW